MPQRIIPAPGSSVVRSLSLADVLLLERGSYHPNTHHPADPIQVRAPSSVSPHPQPSPSPICRSWSDINRQNRIDTIVKSAPRPAPPKRNKVYCDKWVHEGTCAFTQQGCKFKHEMPLDRATQTSLGLFHGLPSWWKKQQAELQRQREPASPTASVASERGASSIGSSARVNEVPSVMEVHTPGFYHKSAGSTNRRDGEGSGYGPGERRTQSPCAFGPIGAPLRGHRGGGGGQHRSGLAASRHNNGSSGLL